MSTTECTVQIHTFKGITREIVFTEMTSSFKGTLQTWYLKLILDPISIVIQELAGLVGTDTKETALAWAAMVASQDFKITREISIHGLFTGEEECPLKVKGLVSLGKWTSHTQAILTSMATDLRTALLKVYTF